VPPFAACLVVAWSPVEISFALAVPDDAYYYFGIARNIVTSNGISFDGLSPTNGFHPLWMISLVPLWGLAGSSQTLPVHLALTLGALLNMVAILGAWSLAYRFTRHRLASGLATLVYAWNPYTVASAVNGLETSLSLFLLVSAIGIYWWARSQKKPETKTWGLLGLAWSLLLLARTDYVFIALFCGIELLWHRRHELTVRTLATAIVAGVLLWLPWLWWNLTTFGTFLQVSGKAYPYYQHTLWQAESHTLGDWLRQEARAAYGIFANLARLSGFNKAIVLLAAASVGMVGLDRSLDISPPGQRSILNRLKTVFPLAAPTMGAVIGLLYHGLVRWMWVPWYFAPLTLLLVLWLALILRWLATWDRRWMLAVGGAFMVFQVWSAADLLQKGGMWPEQARFVQEAMPTLLDICSQVDTIGISDSGYPGYYLPCRVVNLDGVVNNKAFDAIQRHRFRRYLDQIGLEYAILNEMVQRVVSLYEGDVPRSPPFSER
jgi:hypothetical protein